MLRTGIPVTVWLEQPDGVIETALDELASEDKRGRSRDSRLMSG